MPVTRATAAGRAYLDLQNRARRERRSTQELLTFYVLERFLARVAASAYNQEFILKGGLLLAVLDARRPTQDADLLARNLRADEATVAARVQEICLLTLGEDDGVEFRVPTLRTTRIREDGLYAGVRVAMDARIEQAQTKLKLDINVGDPVTPAPVELTYPVLREGQPLRLLGYPLATVLAEKLCTAVSLGEANSRVRDYADVWTLTGRHDLDYADVRAAVEATARHRGVALRPLGESIGELVRVRSSAFTAFRGQLGIDGSELPRRFGDLVRDVLKFADPLLTTAAIRTSWRAAERIWR
ncbi:nucleotidyl transferase AbiEii/AbiGii toxin family protein [Actinopolymorpha sp. NPDC004070]|uniref:nucleotidyl transferase AbiEii/AbiGii toxin family protein n=1 Tax=Actinopolymorpha sp. NPDC004070 TaxID=3154548 RepID=UPI0033B35B28